MKPFLRTAGILLCALLGSAGIVLLLALLLRTVTVLSTDPEDMLPEDTQLFFQSPTKESYEAVRTFVPSIQATLPHPEPYALALVHGSTVSFWKGGDVPEGSGRVRRGAFVVDLPKLLLPQGGSGALSRTSAFRALHRYTRKDTSTVTLDRDLLALPLRGQTTHIRVSLMEGRTDLALFPSKPDAKLSLPPTLPASDENTFLLVASSGEQFADRIIAALSPKVRDTVESILRTETSKLLGEEVSPFAHLMPFITEWTALEIVETSSGTAFLLEGRAGSFDRAQDDTKELHTAFLESLPQSRVTRRLFDGRFLHESIRFDDSKILDERRNVAGYSVRETSGGGRTLATAALGRTVILTTDAALLEERLLHPPTSLFTPPLPAKGPPPRIFAAGRFDATRLPRENSIPSYFGSGTFVWSFGERSNVETLTLVRE